MRPAVTQPPRRGEVWLVRFNPSSGHEMTSPQPAILLSGDSVGKLPLRIAVPLTTHQDRFSNIPWMVTIEARSSNGLRHKSVADCFQVRSLDLQRYVEKWGALLPAEVEVLACTVARVLGVSDLQGGT